MGARASNRLESVRRWRGEADAERDGGRELMSGDIVERELTPVRQSQLHK